MNWIIIVLSVLALAAGIWIGLGAPGWPQKPTSGGAKRRSLEKRPINPVQWGRSGSDRRSRRRR